MGRRHRRADDCSGFVHACGTDWSPGLVTVCRGQPLTDWGKPPVTTLVTEERPAQQAIPRVLASTHTGVDRIFAYVARATGATVLLITGGIGIFLALQSVPTLKHYGW